MRLMKRDLITVYLRRATITQDEEFNDVIAWESPVALEMNVQSASGAVNATIYGSKLSSMKSCKYQGDELKEGRDETVAFACMLIRTVTLIIKSSRFNLILHTSM